MAAGLVGAQMGAQIGLAGGPIGVGLGFIFGGIIGGFTGGIIGRAIERKPIKISLEWLDERYPIITLENVRDKARFVYIVALDTVPNSSTQKYSPWFAFKELGRGDKNKVTINCAKIGPRDKML